MDEATRQFLLAGLARLRVGLFGQMIATNQLLLAQQRKQAAQQRRERNAYELARELRMEARAVRERAGIRW